MTGLAQTEGEPQLPSVADVAAVVADPSRREDALLTLGAISQLSLRLDNGASVDDALASLAADRAWLLRMTSRYGPNPVRSAVLDTAAWQVILQLDSHGLMPTFLASPRDGAFRLFVEETFNRAQPAAALAAAPVLHWHLESDATLVWSQLLLRAEQNPSLAEGLAAQDLSALFQHANATPPDTDGAASPTPLLPEQDLLASARATVDGLIDAVGSVGPLDHRGLQAWRETLLVTLPGLPPGDQVMARHLLHLSRLLNGLHERQFFQLAEGLLAMMAELDRVAADHPLEVQAQAAWMAQWLPTLSRDWARELALVDPRLNSALAAAYDVAQALAREAVGTFGATEHRRQLADAVARLSLLVPDMAYYFELPIRDPVAGGVEACSGMMASTEEGRTSFDRAVFDDCQQTLVDLADGAAREPQLAGDGDGPFDDDTLERELSLTPGQRINYGVGYLLERYNTGCAAPARPLPNPLEWSYLATFMAWLSGQAPVYFQTQENEHRLLRMREIGQELIQGLAEQVDCVAGAGAGVNDPVMRVLADYRDQLTALGRGFNQAETVFRDSVLAEGADIALEGGATQATAYRPVNLSIGPCDVERVCEMTGELSATRALLGLFPDPFLVADQSGLGKLEICYDNVGWVDRRSQPVRAGDENVANYYGRMAFELKGRYSEDGDPVDLFAFHFRSPDEYHYLFSSASEDVLNDACPVEWVGSRIVTPLPDKRFGIVPDRLTYLSASRTLPSRLFKQNWDAGAEWRDWFVTGIGVDQQDLPPPPDILDRLDQHLNALYRREQRAIYGQLLVPAPGRTLRGPSTLFEEASRLSNDKALLRMQMMLFYPGVLFASDSLRAAAVGNNGLLDVLVLKRFQEDNTPVAGVLDTGFNRLDRFEAEWRALPEPLRRNGTVSRSVAQAMMRLDSLYERYFAAPPVIEEAPVPEIPASDGSAPDESAPDQSLEASPEEDTGTSAPDEEEGDSSETDDGSVELPLTQP